MTEQLSADQRKAALSQRVAQEVSRGKRVESQSDFQVVLVKGKRPNHVLHLILTVLTAGVWALVWIGVVVAGGEKRTVLSVDEFGAIQRR